MSDAAGQATGKVERHSRRNLVAACAVLFAVSFGFFCLVFVSGGLIVVGQLVQVLFPSGPVQCATMKCFIVNANQCIPTTYDDRTEMGVFRYSAGKGASGNCTLVKELAKAADREDPFIRRALENRRMECTYQAGKFNGQWTASMIEGLEDCRGELKDAVGELLFLV